MIFAPKMPEFYMIIARKFREKTYPEFSGVTVPYWPPLLPVSYAYCNVSLSKGDIVDENSY